MAAKQGNTAQPAQPVPTEAHAPPGGEPPDAYDLLVAVRDEIEPAVAGLQAAYDAAQDDPNRQNELWHEHEDAEVEYFRLNTAIMKIASSQLTVPPPDPALVEQTLALVDQVENQLNAAATYADAVKLIGDVSSAIDSILNRP